MSSETSAAASGPPGLPASASRDRPSDGPLQRLQRLRAVPGSEPYRINDLLLLRPEEADPDPDLEPSEADPELTEEPRCHRHVVFFHGDIQVSRSGDGVVEEGWGDGRGEGRGKGGLRSSGRFGSHLSHHDGRGFILDRL